VAGKRSRRARFDAREVELDLLLLAVALVIILAGAELFTNGIEWFGHKLGLSEGAIGSVLAAVGTALPETIIPLIAILFGGGAMGNEIGVGAILGAPFMLSTLAMFVTGTAVLAWRKSRPTGTELAIDTGVVGHDMAYFYLAYGLAIAAAFLPVDLEWPRRGLALVLIAIYAGHVIGHVRAEAAAHEGLAPLRFHRFDRKAPPHPEPPRLPIVIVQVVVSLVCIVGGAWVFVGAVEDLASSLGVSSTLLALIIAPIATELPEKFNSVLWVRRGKDTLAMGNITGAMVFQSAFPTAIGLALAPTMWSINGANLAFASAGIAFVSSLVIFVPMKLRGRLGARALLAGGIFYLAYLGAVVANMVATGT
jgi:cation:H+ antiporter